MPQQIPRPNQMLNRLSLCLDDAQRLAAAAKRIADSMKLPVSIAVVDATTYLQAALRLDGAPLMSTEGALDKARSAAEGGHPTTFFEKPLNEGRLSVLRLPVTCVEGGVPVVVDEQCVGAIGIAGGPPHLDGEIAQGAVAAFLNESKESA